MHRSPRTTVAALAALLLCLNAAVPAPVRAAPSSGDRKLAESKALEAKVYFKRSLFREAAEAFMEAYSLSLAPDMMFNAARAYQEAKLPERALALFETYLTLDGVSEEGKTDAAARIATLKRQMGPAEPAAPPVAKVEPAAPKPESAAAPAAPPAGSTAPAAGTPALPASPTSAAATAAPPADKLSWGLLVGGGVLLGLGGVTYAAAIDQANKANRLALDTQEDAVAYNGQFDDAQKARGVAVALALGGAGLAAWGAWRLWLRGPAKPSAGSAAALWVAPSWQTGGASGGPAGGLVAGGRF